VHVHKSIEEHLVSSWSSACQDTMQWIPAAGGRHAREEEWRWKSPCLLIRTPTGWQCVRRPGRWAGRRVQHRRAGQHRFMFKLTSRPTGFGFSFASWSSVIRVPEHQVVEQLQTWTMFAIVA